MQRSRGRFTLAAAAFLVLAIASQALAGVAAPSSAGSTRTTSALGRAGFAYIGGLRVFAAAVLWNRLEPQFHGYYEGVPLVKQDYIIPTLALVQALDPQFERAYYLSSYFVARRVSDERGIEIAREGLRNNPDSGLLKSNLAQLLFLDDKVSNGAEAKSLALSGLSTSTRWMDDEDRFEAYAIFRDILLDAGDEDLATRLNEAMTQMRGAGIGTGDHDHDGDGQQDH